MTVAVVNINDVLDGHVALEVDCVDRLYLTGDGSGRRDPSSSDTPTIRTRRSRDGAAPTRRGPASRNTVTARCAVRRNAHVRAASRRTDLPTTQPSAVLGRRRGERLERTPRHRTEHPPRLGGGRAHDHGDVLAGPLACRRGVRSGVHRAAERARQWRGARPAPEHGTRMMAGGARERGFVDRADGALGTAPIAPAFITSRWTRRDGQRPSASRCSRPSAARARSGRTR